MSVKSTIENLLLKANDFDRETQMMVLKLADEINNDPATFGLDEEGEDEIFTLAVRMWRYICDNDHNHCALTECKYSDFVNDILQTPLEEIHYLWEGYQCGDWDAQDLLKDIAFFRLRQ
jgi:hypothetical protein